MTWHISPTLRNHIYVYKENQQKIIRILTIFSIISDLNKIVSTLRSVKIKEPNEYRLVQKTHHCFKNLLLGFDY